MKAEVVYQDLYSQIIVSRDGTIIYLWHNTVGKVSKVFCMTEESYIEMVEKMVKIANGEEQ